MSGSFIILIRLVNETNFFIVFIALIVIFFLLGIILGNIFGRPAKGPKINTDTRNPVKGEVIKPKQAADNQVQDKQESAAPQDTDQNQRPRDPRIKYYNWW